MNLSPIALVAVLTAVLGAGQAPPNAPTEKGPTVTQRARGSFDVKVAPVQQEPFPDGIVLGRFTLDKQYHGDLEGTGKGEMLTAGTPVEGSAGYVAIERFDGSLHGRRGTFALQHLGVMAHDDQRLTIAVVPDSGTGELAGLGGTLDIVIAEGQHSYEFVYSLAARP